MSLVPGLLLWAVPLAPLALLVWVLLDRTKRRGPLVAALGPLPALAAALVAGGASSEAGWLLLGARVELDPVGRLFLLLVALAWLLASLFAHGSLSGDMDARRGYRSERQRFTLFWLLTMSGNLGLVVAGDVVTFYLAFVLMTFAAYGLVVHERTAEATRAARVYIVMAVIGEAALVAGLVAAAWAAGGALEPEAIRAALAASPYRDLIVGLLIAGFGVKAGLVVLHVWLPLAHPAAPTPASAVLSGAMIKAGLLGWLRFLPLGEAPAETWGAILVALGFAGVFLAALAGLPQRDPKVTLAYSSVSQMGVMTVAAGLALGAVGAASLALAAAALYALHHGLAKATLFLGVGLAPLARGRRGWLFLAGLALAALAVAGAPLTSGMVAKAVVKEAATAAAGPAGAATLLLLPLSSVATTLLLSRYLWLIRGAVREGTRPAGAREEGAGGWLLAGWGLTLAASLFLVWLLPRAWLLGVEAGDALSPAGFWEATWPVAIGVSLAAVVAATGARRAPPRLAIPPGDLVVLVERGGGWALTWWRVLAPGAARVGVSTYRAGRRLAALGLAGDTLERWLGSWSVAGTLFAALIVLLIVLA